MFSKAKKGFTLVELAIVLVVVGLLAAMVSGAASMMESSKTTTIISEIAYFTQAEESFFDKYKYHPGDVPSQYLTGNFSGNSTHGCGSAVWGNGKWDNLTEEDLVWLQLSYADYIKQEINFDPCTGGFWRKPGDGRPASDDGVTGYTFLQIITLNASRTDEPIPALQYLYVLRLGTSVNAADTNFYKGTITVAMHRMIDSKIDQANTPFYGRYVVGVECTDRRPGGVGTLGYLKDDEVVCNGNYVKINPNANVSFNFTDLEPAAGVEEETTGVVANPGHAIPNDDSDSFESADADNSEGEEAAPNPQAGNVTESANTPPASGAVGMPVTVAEENTPEEEEVAEEEAAEEVCAVGDKTCEEVAEEEATEEECAAGDKTCGEEVAEEETGDECKPGDDCDVLANGECKGTAEECKVETEIAQCQQKLVNILTALGVKVEADKQIKWTELDKAFTTIGTTAKDFVLNRKITGCETALNNIKDPVKPNEETEVVITDPVDPVKPSEPTQDEPVIVITDPIDPVKPNEPVKEEPEVVITDPVEPVKPNEPTKDEPVIVITDPVEPVKPNEPVKEDPEVVIKDPVKPTEPTKEEPEVVIKDPVKPNDPTKDPVVVIKEPIKPVKEEPSKELTKEELIKEELTKEETIKKEAVVKKEATVFKELPASMKTKTQANTSAVAATGF